MGANAVIDGSYDRAPVGLFKGYKVLKYVRRCRIPRIGGNEWASFAEWPGSQRKNRS